MLAASQPGIVSNAGVRATQRHADERLRGRRNLMSLALPLLEMLGARRKSSRGSRRVVVRRARPPLEPDAAFAAPRQVAVVAAVKEINGEADDEPDGKPQPCIAR